MNRLDRALLRLLPMIVLCVLPATPDLRAEASGLTGVVTNLATGAPVAGAWVSAAGRPAPIGVEGRGAVTGADGRYALALEPGTHDVRIEAPGYIGMTERYRRVVTGEVASLDVAMIPIDPTEAEARAIDAALLAAAAARELAQAEAPPLLAGPDLHAVSRAPETVRVLMPDGYAVVMAMDEYLKGVVPHEMPASWPAEALKAQAVAARSYAATARRHRNADPARDAHVCTTTHCQVWSPTHYDTTDRAVEATSGVVATYGGSVIQAFYHARCGGHTRNVEDVWVSYLPYARGVPCPCGATPRLGHGVGMCQWGARALALQGRGYADILRHYYTGIQVVGPAAVRIISGTVEPTHGDRGTLFTFRATYTSGAAGLPAAAHVIVAGRSYALRRAATDPHGVQTYLLTTRLPAGNHAARFYFDDGRGAISTHDLAGPAVQATAGTPAPAAPEADAIITHSTSGDRGDWAAGTFNGVRHVPLGDGALTLDPGRSSGVYTSAPIAAPMAFIALAAQWHASVPAGAALAWEVRTRHGGGDWGAWSALSVKEDEGGPGATAASNLVIGEADALQYRLTLRANSAGRGPVLENVSWVFLDTRAGPTAREVATDRSGPPGIISRAGWGADERLMTRPPEYHTPRAMIVHHTVTPTGGLDPAAIVRAIYRYHAIHRGMGDIGYNYLIDHLGRIYEGRYGGAGVVGSHAGMFNSGSIGVALIGDHQVNPVPEPAFASLARLLAWRSVDHGIDPGGQSSFVGRVLPNIMGHRDCGATLCPGVEAYDRLPELRNRVRAEMASVPPRISLLAPAGDARLRGVAPVAVRASSVVTRLDVYVDGAWVEAIDVTPTPRSPEGVPGPSAATGLWNTRLVADGRRLLRIVASNVGGNDEATVTVTVDNTPPTNAFVEAPTWSRSPRVSLLLGADDAAAVQFSYGWVWEGEDFETRVGRVIADPTAHGGRALQGRPQDPPGFWFGPYTCVLPKGRDYQAVFRLKTPSRAAPGELARLDVVDSRARRVLAEHSLLAAAFSREGAYDEFVLPFTYPDDAICAEGDRNGLEFRTRYLGNAELTLDRVTVWSAPQPMASTVRWDARPQEGAQTVMVRLLDAVGNAADREVTVRIDSTPPAWIDQGATWASVRDALSGLDPASAAYAISQDDGLTWGPWQPLTLTAPLDITSTVRLEAPSGAGPLARFRIDDLAGNASWTRGWQDFFPFVARN